MFWLLTQLNHSLLLHNWFDSVLTACPSPPLSYLWKSSLSIITSPTDSLLACRNLSMQSFKRGSEGWRPVFLRALKTVREIKYQNHEWMDGWIYGWMNGWMDTYCDKVWNGDLLFSICDGVEEHVFHSRAGAPQLWLDISVEKMSTFVDSKTSFSCLPRQILKTQMIISLGCFFKYKKYQQGSIFKSFCLFQYFFLISVGLLLPLTLEICPL